MMPPGLAINMSQHPIKSKCILFVFVLLLIKIEVENKEFGWSLQESPLAAYLKLCCGVTVMGIKGRRVHMIEELSDTIISFQRGMNARCGLCCEVLAHGVAGSSYFLFSLPKHLYYPLFQRINHPNNCTVISLKLN